MNILIRLLFNKAVLILGAVAIIVLVNERMQWIDTSPLHDGPAAISDESSDVETTTSQANPSPTKSSTVRQTTPSQPKITGVTITYPYTEAIRNEPYYIDWGAQSGAYATIRLLHTGEEPVAVPGCTALPVTPGVSSTCVWKPGAVDQLQGREGYSLELSVYTESGGVVDTAQTGTFTMATTFTTPLQTYEDETYGWAIRYPELWVKKVTSGRAIFAKNSTALQNPLTSDEAVSIEFCSLARVDCQDKRDTMLKLPGATTGSLVNKRTTMVVVPEGDAYRRQDMFERSGILFTVTTRAVTTDGVVRSPYTRKALEEIDFEAPRLSSELYEFSRSSRSGSLTLELTDARITYARLLSIANGCESKLDTTTFKTQNANGFTIARGACNITATKDGNSYALEENDCESVHTGSCTFEGEYHLDS